MGCGCRPEEVDHMVVRHSAGGWHVYLIGRDGEQIRMLDEAHAHSAHAQGEADALGLGVPVVLR